ncbi:MAG: hypothetical protein H6712_28395 [Myxococcales bacterium]|nr:hypothetical protein [Myxococcales bacterium]MCB9717802.1 hypothetical protein [Myxococcales bacterium]
MQATSSTATGSCGPGPVELPDSEDDPELVLPPVEPEPVEPEPVEPPELESGPVPWVVSGSGLVEPELVAGGPELDESSPVVDPLEPVEV